MTDVRDLGPDQSVDLPGTVLRVRLTGAVSGNTVFALQAGDADATFRRVGPGEILVRPGVAVRLLGRPADGERFLDGTRLGLDVRVEDERQQRQVLVQQVDVGALVDFQLAKLELTESGGWRLTAHGTGEVEQMSEPGPSPLDEQLHPWLVQGRYAVRTAGTPPRNQPCPPWGLVLDASLSMRVTFDERSLVSLVQLVAGIMCEWTGQLPHTAWSSGLSAPTVIAGGEDEPALLVRSVLEAAAPPSWSLVTPAVTDAHRRGARLIALVTDGVPSDVRDLEAAIGALPDLEMVVVTTGQSAYALTSDRDSDAEELGPLAVLAAAEKVRLVAVNPSTIEDPARAVELARAMTREASWGA